MADLLEQRQQLFTFLQVADGSDLGLVDGGCDQCDAPCAGVIQEQENSIGLQPNSKLGLIVKRPA
jgi:hypothetical protein